MSISRAECHDKIENQFLRDFSQMNNISKLTSNSWGNDKTACVDAMGGMVAVNNALEQIKQNKVEQPHLAPTTVNNSQQTTQQTHQVVPTAVDEMANSLLAGVKTVGQYILLAIVIAIGIRILYYLICKALRYGYAFFNAHRIIFLKVLLPRGDGKTDREQEKEVAKDMKEKI